MSKNDPKTEADAAVKQVTVYTAEQLPGFEQRLQELNEAIRRMEKERSRLRAIVAACRYHGEEFNAVDDVPTPPWKLGKRMTRRAALQRRAEAGAAIYKYMRGKPKDTLFSYGLLQDHFDRSISFMFPRIISEWNEANPDKQIGHNGKPRAERRYHLI